MFWLIGAMIAVVCALLLTSVILKLHERDFYLLRGVTRIVHRPLFELVLILFMVGGVVRYAATKGTNGNDRAGLPSPSPITDTGSSRQDGATETTRQPGEITNLCFTGINVSSNFVTLEVAWPTNFFADGTILDYFAKPYSLDRVWQWIGCRDALPGTTNQVVVFDAADIEGVTNQSSAMFFKVQDRLSCATTMADADGDGLPDVYELQNGTNPYVPDYEFAPKITVGAGGAYSSIESALAASQPYSLISLAAEEWSLNQALRMPSHPVMLAGPNDGYAVLRTSASIGAVILDQGQDSQTLFRNLYLVLEAQGNFQSGFWVGGNLPWSGLGSSPTFENIRIRGMYPNTLYYGWHFYRDNGDTSVISNCVMNAANTTAEIGVYVYDGPSVDVLDSSFVNFPTNGDGFATCFRRGTNIVTQTAMPDANLSWAGYPLGATFSASQDSDGDGLSDYDEIHEYDTDPLLADSDGDGVADDAELEVGTDPHDVADFVGVLRVSVTNTISHGGVTNYVYSGNVPNQDSYLFACTGHGCTTSLVIGVTGIVDSMCVYRDLNRNGRYDETNDIILVKGCGGAYSVRSVTFAFGDVDGDGVSDLDERIHATDPYSAKSYRVNRTVQIKDKDSSAGITNYYAFSVSTNMSAAFLTGRFSGGHVSVPIQENATNGCLYLSVYRDLNRNGVYDEGIDAIAKATINNSTTIALNVGDADNDGITDSTEISDNTDPLDRRNYRLESWVFYESLDGDLSITNYVQLSPNTSSWEERPAEWFVGHCSSNMAVRGIVTNANFFANVFRDLNRNGVFDADIDIFKSEALSSWQNHRENGFLIGDFDSDGVCDSEELGVGTDPTNNLSYAFNLDLTMGGVFSTSNNLTGVVMFGDRTIVEPFVATSHVFSCRLTNLVTQTGENVSVVFWEDHNSNGIRDVQELFTSQRIIVDGTNTVVYCRLPLGPFDGDQDGMLDCWEIEHGLSPLDASDALNDDDVDGLINLHEYVAECNPKAYDGTNTALYAFCHSIDDRLMDQNKQSQLTYSGGVRNRSCWAYGIDTSSASPWNSDLGGYKAGTAISKRHIVFAAHYQIANDKTIRFVGTNDVVYYRTLVDSRVVIGTDLCVGVLSSDLPEDVSPAMILPKNYCMYLGDAKRVPMLMYDFDEKSIVTDSNILRYPCENADGLRPESIIRLQHFEGVQSGDSGDPKYFIDHDRAILICTLLSYGTGASGIGPFITTYRDRVQNVMNYLCPGYELIDCDLSTYRCFDDE